MSRSAASTPSPTNEPHDTHEPSPDRAESEPLPENIDPKGILYAEKLSAAWWMWLLVLLTGATAFLALAPISIWAGTIATAVVAGGTTVALAASSSSIVITEDWVQVGRARIERRFVGEAEAFRGDDVRRVRGPELDGRAYMNFRASVGPVVRIHILDPVDPTPYWLTSTRHPERIVEVLAANR